MCDVSVFYGYKSFSHLSAHEKIGLFQEFEKNLTNGIVLIVKGMAFQKCLSELGESNHIS